VLGDAAGYVEPFTGEGMAWALRSSSAALPIVTDAIVNGWLPRHAQQWDKAYRLAVRKNQWRCRLFSAVLRRPRLTRAVLATTGRLPERVRHTGSCLALPPMFGAHRVACRATEGR